MIDVFFLEGYTVAVMGLGRSGLSAAKALVRSGADVWAWDDNEDRRAAAAEEEIPLVDLYRCNWDEPCMLVLSPGIPHTHPEPHPVAALARQADCEILCDVELLGRAQRDTGYIGVTGTNGKSTTTALLGHILELAGREVEVGGNFGVPALDLHPLDVGGTYVLEMSSYQLELTRSITFDIAVLLNISPDHLERHGGLEGYVAAKRMIFHRQTSPRSAVIAVDDDHCRAIHHDLVAAADQRIVPVSATGRVEGGVYVLDGILHDELDGDDVAVVDLRAIPTLPGTHNWQNAAAAYAAARASGVQPAVIKTGLEGFPGLAHRQELLAIIDGVRYVNDSKATNADAAAKALASYDRIYWIAGGRPKERGIDSLAPLFPRVAHAFLIGEAAESFARTLEGKVPYTVSRDLRTAVRQARDRAVKEADQEAGESPVVLFSPACASFDQFQNFEARGEAFCRLVDALPGARVDLDELVPGGATP